MDFELRPEHRGQLRRCARLTRTGLSASDLRSILPYLSVNHTLGSLEFRICRDGICYNQIDVPPA